MNHQLGHPKFRLYALATVIGLALYSLWPAAGGAAETDKFHGVEAAFIYQFTSYIEWSAHPVGENFVISVVGKSALIDKLRILSETKTVKGKPVTMHLDPDAAQMKKSQIVVLVQPDPAALQDILAKTADTGALVISHGEGLGQAGATINFFIEDGRVRFEINRPAAEKRKLQISSQLLKLAKLIE